jgi:hypothetical protein
VKPHPFIEAEEAAGHSVKRCCELFEVSRAAYYQRRNCEPSARELSDVELTEQISEIHTDSNGTYGSPRVTRELRHRGVACGRRRVRRLMRLAGLEGRAKKRWRTTTIPDPDVERARDLIQRHFGPCPEIDRRYVGDITYVATWEGWAYLATEIDLASRKVVGWGVGRPPAHRAGHRRPRDGVHHPPTPPGAIFHSDRRCPARVQGSLREISARCSRPSSNCSLLVAVIWPLDRLWRPLTPSVPAWVLECWEASPGIRRRSGRQQRLSERCGGCCGLRCRPGHRFSP